MEPREYGTPGHSATLMHDVGAYQRLVSRLEKKKKIINIWLIERVSLAHSAN